MVSDVKTGTLALSFLVVCAALSFTLVKSATIRSPGQFGALVLCPPGGRAFNMAWRLACEMRRKKRSIEEPPKIVESHMQPAMAKKAASDDDDDAKDWRPATMTEMQDICCKNGCEIRDLLSYCDPFGQWNS